MAHSAGKQEPMEIQEIAYSKSVSCSWCRASAGASCTTPNGKERDNHRARWQLIEHMVKTSKAYFRLKGDQPRFGLSKDDVLLCVNYPYDAKVSVLSRVSDGYDPECNMYTHDVRFLNWA